MNTMLLRQSFEFVARREPELTTRFYAVLFERHPQVRPLFGRNRPHEQARMLRDALVAVLDHLEDAPWLAEQLAALGRRHLTYGVTEEMYDWVGDALLRTLAEVAGPEWNEELEQAWTEAYGAIRAGMLAAAKP